MIVNVARTDELDPVTLYRLLWLRVEVFVVEQACAYPELDGRDLEPGTRHFWYAEPTGAPTAYLRLLADPDGVARIGRVCTAATARGQGLSGRLVVAALEATAGQVAVLDAQAHLVGFYARYGFTEAGPEYVEDGIPHVPMRREPA